MYSLHPTKQAGAAHLPAFRRKHSTMSRLCMITSGAAYGALDDCTLALPAWGMVVPSLSFPPFPFLLRCVPKTRLQQDHFECKQHLALNYDEGFQ